MQVVQASEKLPQNDSNILLMDGTGSQQVKATATGAVLHDDPQVRALQIRSVVLGDIWGVQFGENGNLLNDIVDFVFGVFNVDDLNGDCFSGPLVVPNVKGKL